MRIRATVAAVTGALALSALAVPAAQADDHMPNLASLVPSTSKATPFAAAAPADEGMGDTKITGVTVNGGKNIVVGTTAMKSFTVSVTATDPEGIYDAYPVLWHGTDPDNADGAIVPESLDQEMVGDCTHSSATTATCKVTLIADPSTNIYSNILAGTWKVWVGAIGNDGDYVIRDAYKTAKVQRASKLTVNASPEPVVKGKTITVTGKLSRANWDDHKYHGYTNQPVKLQFRKKGSDTYTTLKTITSNSTGELKTTVKASTDGYFRYSFAGTTTTPAVNATGDFVDVR
ncbi:calcium-binding protein [Streptomyces swartbergensis]|uniref:Calcium-binding protein n=1 Tax=Streptomyces swartbergensis TaxID=487165 RepID=A0A243S6A6_9ACTN|nr:calcium-binding protein [Streptomyces swartbergensis]OUD02481.1 calcium-binding protein [Streptomyces swartbergensis]